MLQQKNTETFVFSNVSKRTVDTFQLIRVVGEISYEYYLATSNKHIYCRMYKIYQLLKTKHP